MPIASFHTRIHARTRAQTMVVMMTELIFGILTNEGRTCNSFDLLIQSNAKIVNIIVICVAVVALLFVFAGKPTRTFPDWGAWRYPIMVRRDLAGELCVGGCGGWLEGWRAVGR